MVAQAVSSADPVMVPAVNSDDLGLSSAVLVIVQVVNSDGCGFGDVLGSPCSYAPHSHSHSISVGD